MAITNTITTAHKGGASTVSQSVTVTGNAENRYEIAVASDASDLHAEVHIPTTECKALTMLASQTLSIEYNDASGSQGDITLTANVPLTWYTGCPWSLANVGVAEDITDIYITNDAGTTATTLYITVLYDPTP